uniref:DUF6685 family protein n=1 Tax=Serratia marcescens TaxID=615 RepID=UPI00300D9A9F
MPDFDFYKIQSLTASKSFGQHYNNQINGSWFNSVYEWGAGMYPDKNLKAENIEDWKKNIYHIEREGFCRNSPLRITYYEWVDRYVASNSGGSHHAAMVVYQSIRDKLEYRREAEIETQAINNKRVNELVREYYSFIVKPKKKSKSEILKSDFLYALRQVLNCKVNTLIPVHYCSNVEFIFIRKQDLNIDMKLIESWLEYSKKCGKIILLAEYLTEPLKYHTKQYHHDLGRIYLGDPCREYKKNLK